MPVLSRSEHHSSERIENPYIYSLPDYANPKEQRGAGSYFWGNKENLIELFPGQNAAKGWQGVTLGAATSIPPFQQFKIGAKYSDTYYWNWD